MTDRPQDGLLHLACLPEAQRRLWPRLAAVPSRFILYGGTALALHLGHRVSEDFDFFCGGEFNPRSLRRSMEILRSASTCKIEKTALYATLPDGGVKISFFGDFLPCRHLVREPFRADNGVRVASLPDIFGSKCRAIRGRAKHRDYIDICAILERTDYSLSDGLSFALEVSSNKFNPGSALQSLGFYEDLDDPLPAKQQALLQEAIHSVDLDKLPSPRRHEQPSRDDGWKR